jgi:hypothetical protein
MAVATALLVLAQHTQDVPDDRLGAGLIIGAVLFVALVAALLFFVVTRTTRASRGGVEPPRGQKRPGKRRS